MFKPHSSIVFNTMSYIVQNVKMDTSLTTLKIPSLKFVLDVKSKDALNAEIRECAENVKTDIFWIT